MNRKTAGALLIAIMVWILPSTAALADGLPTPTGSSTSATAEPSASATQATTSASPTSESTTSLATSTPAPSSTPSSASVTASPTTSTVAPPSPAPVIPASKLGWVFGDSIAAGGWLADPSKDWVNELQGYVSGITLKNFAVGGMALHQTDTYQQQLLDHIKSTVATERSRGRAMPDFVILAIGTNDMIGHTVEAPSYSGQAIYYSMWAATQVEAYLQSLGVKKILWNTVYPWAAKAPNPAYPGYVLPVWVGPLMQRTATFNNWLSAMYGPNVIHTDWVMYDWTCWCMGNSTKFLDGFHPNTDGHAQIAWAFARTGILP